MREGGRLLYGGLEDVGVSIAWRDFEPAKGFEWSRSFQSGSLELCLNLAGEGSLHCATGRMELEPLTAGLYVPGGEGLRAWRKPGARQRFLTVAFTSRFLRRHLSQCDGALDPLVERFVLDAACPAGVGEVRRLTPEQEREAARLLHPPTVQAARGLWYQSQVLQLMVTHFFTRGGADELFCERQQRVARERVERVVALLRQHLAAPPALDEIGRQAGCSPFYLSRTFSREMGMTIPQYLRKLRMERAADLLRSGKYNVTEAALEVGYASLSHFSQAFCQTMGCCPALYPLKAPSPATGSPETPPPGTR